MFRNKQKGITEIIHRKNLWQSIIFAFSIQIMKYNSLKLYKL
jgi:hypothetical protein